MEQNSLSKTLTSVVEFFIGFFIGALVEYVAIKLYMKWDISKKSKVKLFIVAVIELFIIILLAQNFQRMAIFGLFSSQFFIFDYALGRFYNPIKNL